MNLSREIQLRTVEEYHAVMRDNGANMAFMGWYDEDGNELKVGYVVSGYSVPDSHKYFESLKKAEMFMLKSYKLKKEKNEKRNKKGKVSKSIENGGN